MPLHPLPASTMVPRARSRARWTAELVAVWTVFALLSTAQSAVRASERGPIV